VDVIIHVSLVQLVAICVSEQLNVIEVVNIHTQEIVVLEAVNDPIMLWGQEGVCDLQVKD
jgi:hypothetical protein